MLAEPAADWSQESADDAGPAERPEPFRPSLTRGMEVIAETARGLPGGPGVYRMLNRRGDALYVGKAHSLKKRVATYAQIAKLSCSKAISSSA
jgi:excinuclease ABC subunit C